MGNQCNCDKNFNQDNDVVFEPHNSQIEIKNKENHYTAKADKKSQVQSDEGNKFKIFLEEDKTQNKQKLNVQNFDSPNPAHNELIKLGEFEKNDEEKIENNEPVKIDSVLIDKRQDREEGLKTNDENSASADFNKNANENESLQNKNYYNHNTNAGGESDKNDQTFQPNNNTITLEEKTEFEKKEAIKEENQDEDDEEVLIDSQEPISQFFLGKKAATSYKINHPLQNHGVEGFSKGVQSQVKRFLNNKVLDGM